AHVADRDLPVDLIVAPALVDHPVHELVVLPALDRAREDRRIARQPADPVANQRVESPARDQIAINEIDPGTLPLLGVQPLERVHRYLASALGCDAVSTSHLACATAVRRAIHGTTRAIARSCGGDAPRRARRRI